MARIKAQSLPTVAVAGFTLVASLAASASAQGASDWPEPRLELPTHPQTADFKKPTPPNGGVAASASTRLPWDEPVGESRSATDGSSSTAQLGSAFQEEQGGSGQCSGRLSSGQARMVADQADAALMEAGQQFHDQYELDDAFQQHVEAALKNVTTGSWSDDIVLRNDISAEIQSLGTDELAACLPNYANAVAGIASNQAAQAQAYQRQQDAQKQEAEARAREAEKPENILRAGYENYITVRKCHEQREGYALVYVSDEELYRSRDAIKRIEDKVKTLEPGVDTDRVWFLASHPQTNGSDQDARTKMLSIIIAGGEENLCKLALNTLGRILQKLDPESTIPDKDF